MEVLETFLKSNMLEFSNKLYNHSINEEGLNTFEMLVNSNELIGIEDAIYFKINNVIFKIKECKTYVAYHDNQYLNQIHDRFIDYVYLVISGYFENESFV